MKLTLAQITLIESALTEHADLCRSRSYNAFLSPDKAFWDAEAVEAARLQDLFKEALSVDVESVKLEPAKAAEPEPREEVADMLVVREGELARPLAKLVPPLLNAIDECSTGAEARDVLRNAAPADRRAVAKFLGIPTNDLLDVITRRKAA